MRIDLKLHAAFLKSGKTLALAESCTGGAVAAAITVIPGASKFLLGSLVVYSNAWKEKFLGISSETLSNGAVSHQVAEEMLRGLFHQTKCDFAAAVTGLAGPDGDSSAMPVGTIFIAVGKRGEPIDIRRIQASGTRQAIIDEAVQTTLEALLERLTA